MSAPPPKADMRRQADRDQLPRRNQLLDFGCAVHGLMAVYLVLLAWLTIRGTAQSIEQDVT